MVKGRLMLRTIPSGLTSGILENKLLAKRASRQPSEMVSVEQFVVRNLKGLWLDPPGLWLKRIGTAPWCANVPCKLIALILDRPTWMQFRRYGQCDMPLAFRERARTCIRDRSRCIFRSIDMCLRRATQSVHKLQTGFPRRTPYTAQNSHFSNVWRS